MEGADTPFRVQVCPALLFSISNPQAGRQRLARIHVYIPAYRVEDTYLHSIATSHMYTLSLDGDFIGGYHHPLRRFRANAGVFKAKQKSSRKIHAEKLTE